MASNRRSLGEGAAQFAPTAPHATPPKVAPKKVTGPAHFWHRSMRFVLGITLLASLLTHTAWLNPIKGTSGFDVNDRDGDVDIAVDLLEEAPPAEQVKAAETKPIGEGLDGGLGAADGSADADASRSGDAAKGTDGGAGAADAAADALGEAAVASGTPDNGPKDALGIVGSAGAIKAADVYVTVAVNAEAIRKNSIGKQSGPLLQELRQWKNFLEGTKIDPVRDADWVMISGPSLKDTTKAVIAIRYNFTDEQMDAACAFMASRYDKGGPYDTGIAGMKAWLAFADRGERILLRPQSHMLVILPSRKTLNPEKEKQLIKKIHETVYPTKLKNADEAVRVIVKEPNHAVAQIPKGLTEVRLRAVPGANDSGTVYLEGDCPSEAVCLASEKELKDTLADLSGTAFAASFIMNVPAGVKKVLEQTAVTHDAKHVRMQIELDKKDLQELLTFMSGFLKKGGF